MLSSRTRLSFNEARKRQQQSGSCIQNRITCILLTFILFIMAIFVAVYFDVASHASLAVISSTDPPEDVIYDDANKSPDAASHPSPFGSNAQSDGPSSTRTISSYPGYTHSLDPKDANFVNLLHRRSLGFSADDHSAMHSIITKYAAFATETMANDAKSGTLNGKYIVLTPAAQMCNRMRAFMGSMLLGLLTQRVVFIDIGAEGYAARFNHIFKSPGYEWEYRAIPNELKSMMGKSGQKHTFPYEWLNKDRAASGTVHKMVCDEWLGNTNAVWSINSHAAYLPVMARNANLYRAVVNWHENGEGGDDGWHFDLDLAQHFMSKIAADGQESIENLEVLLGRILYRLEDQMQSAVDGLIKETYDKATAYYKSKGVDLSPFEGHQVPPPVIGIHIRSEYVLLMNPKDCVGRKIAGCDKPYRWFEGCGIAAMGQSAEQMLGDKVAPYLFIAADTKEAQQAAVQIFGGERVHFRPFDKTGGSFEGIQEAVIDLVSVSSFDVFVGTPHSSYSEMAAVLGQPRRRWDDEGGKWQFMWSVKEGEEHWVAVNRMIVPIMTTVGWEIDKLNLYTMGRVVDVDIDSKGEGGQRYEVLLPQTKEQKPPYQEHRICKQAVTAGMGWMGLFDMLRNVKCHQKEWHHPGQGWFPIAD